MVKTNKQIKVLAEYNFWEVLNDAPGKNILYINRDDMKAEIVDPDINTGTYANYTWKAVYINPVTKTTQK